MPQSPHAAEMREMRIDNEPNVLSISHARTDARMHTHTHPFNGPLSRTTRMSRYQKGTTNLDFTEARDSEWQWHQLYASMHLAPDR